MSVCITAMAPSTTVLAIVIAVFAACLLLAPTAPRLGTPKLLKNPVATPTILPANISALCGASKLWVTGIASVP